MKQASLPSLVALLACPFLLPVDPGVPSSQTEAPAALFFARSARLDGDALLVADLREVDPKAGTGALGGRVLIGGEGAAELGLWTLTVGADMERTTPLLGKEGPGATFLKPGHNTTERSDFVPFRGPIRVKLTYLGADGSPRCTEERIVREIRLAGDRP